MSTEIIMTLSARLANKRVHQFSGIDPQDIQSAAIVAMLEALPRFDETKGALDKYLSTVGWRACTKAYVHARSPVTYRAGSGHKEDLAVLVSVVATGVKAHHMVDLAPEERVHQKFMRELVRKRIRVACDTTIRGHLAEQVLLGERPATVAAKAEVPVRLVYKATDLARRKLARDETLHRVWSER